jgi:protein-L-isoaspartate O-methyltransferase
LAVRTLLTKAIEYLGAVFPKSLCFFALYYNNLVDREIGRAAISQKDRVLCIGGGPLPYTAIRIASMTKAKVTVVDMDKRAVRCAERIVRRLKLHNYINVKTGDAQCMEIFGYDVVHIAFQVHPKERILQNILAKNTGSIRIIIRDGSGEILKGKESFNNGACLYASKTNSLVSVVLFLQGQGKKEYNHEDCCFDADRGFIGGNAVLAH